MPRTIAVYGSSFNPPGLHHRRVAEELRRRFDSVVIVPCGPRPDKPSVDDTDPVYRAAMVDMAFRTTGAEVDLFDLEHAVFTRTHELESRYADRGDVWHVIRSDLVCGGSRRQSPIHLTWHHGQRVWEELKFIVIVPEGHEVHSNDLPPKHRLLRLPVNPHDDPLREKIYRSEPVGHLLEPRVAQFITRRGLYQGRIPRRASRWKCEDPRLMIVHDDRNARAREWTDRLRPFESLKDPNCIVVLGGDGTMLHAIQRHWRLRVPFLGINAGHLGFLLNDAERMLVDPFPPQPIILRHMPLLYVEMQLPDGSWRGGLTFNDAWVERFSGQTAWLQISIDGQVRLAKVVCDGVLLSTAAGSTAYARAMGATPLLADTPAWLIVGSNVMQPMHWKSALLSLDATVEVRNLDPEKRPVTGYLYGVGLGEVRAMRARVSRIAAVELAFHPEHDVTEKITRIQFPVCDP